MPERQIGIIGFIEIVIGCSDCTTYIYVCECIVLYAVFFNTCWFSVNLCFVCFQMFVFIIAEIAKRTCFGSALLCVCVYLYVYVVLIFVVLENLEKWNAPRFCARPGSQPDTFLAFSGVSIPQQKSASANKIGNCTNNIWFFVGLFVCLVLWVCVFVCFYVFQFCWVQMYEAPK